MNTDRAKIAILPIDSVSTETLQMIEKGIRNVFSTADCMILDTTMPIPEDTYNPIRRQYYSPRILEKMSDYTRKYSADYFLGVTNVDLYVPSLNFIFGEARCPGKVALISLFRLKQKFYGLPPNQKLYFERAVKEAAHEIGHAFGLKHCKNHLCVMFFSNSIAETDHKEQKLCEKCSRLLSYIFGKT